MARNTMWLFLLIAAYGCASSEFYFFNNLSDTEKTITVTYVQPEEDMTEVSTPPDSLLIGKDEFEYKPWKWNKKSTEKVAYRQLDDVTYQFILNSGQKVMIPPRYLYENSLKLVVLGPNQEVVFLNEYNERFEILGENTKSIEVSYKAKMIGDGYYLIRMKE